MNSIINSLKSLAQRADHPAGLTITRRGCPPGDLLPFPSFFVIVNNCGKAFSPDRRPRKCDKPQFVTSPTRSPSPTSIRRSSEAKIPTGNCDW